MASDLPAFSLASADWYGSSAPRLLPAVSIQESILQAFYQQTALAARLGQRLDADPALAVHAMRRLLRRSRALLRLTASALSDADRRAWLAQLGEASRQLGRHRDAEVLPDALLLLPEPARESVAPLRLLLDHQRDLARRDPDVGPAIQAAAIAIAEVGAQLPAALHQLGAAHLAEGLAAAFQRVEDCAMHAHKRPRPQAIHALRKRAKDVRHMLEWLGCDQDAPRLQRVAKAVRDLGEVADLLVLHAWLKEAVRRHPDVHHGALLQALRTRKAKLARRSLRGSRDLAPSHPKQRAQAIVRRWLAASDASAEHL